jgi:hypothetical protein
MEKSLFPQWVDKYFKIIAQKVVEKLNGGKMPLPYFHRTMLRKEFSATLKWGSLSVNGNVVSADVVAMDSSLPLKKRDSIRKADGDIPKLGMKLSLNESTMNELNILLATAGPDTEVLRKLFADADRCISGIWERLEFMFLQALSTGVILVTDEDNPGLGIRVNFGHPDSNKYGVGTPWTDASSKPIDDIEHVISQARLKGYVVRYILMDKDTFNAFKANSQVKEQYAFYLGYTGSNVPAVPSVDKANEFLSANQGVQITVIDRPVQVEIAGKRKSVNPWEAGAVVFLTDMMVGTLTYGTLAEETFSDKSVDYQKVDDFILVSKYHKNDPIREFTSSQALVLPVINNVDSIYIMNTKEAATDTQTEGDANFDYKGTSYTKASVVASYLLIKPTSTITIDTADATLLKLINKLSAEEELAFVAELVEAV